MNKSRFYLVCKHVLLVLLLVCAFVLQTTPRLFEIYGVKPNLLVPMAVCIAMYEGDFSGGVYGALAGLLCDLASFTLFGFNGLILLLCGTAVGLLEIYWIRQKLSNALLCAGGALLLRAFLEYFFYFQVWGYDDVGWLLLRQTLPTVLYSMVPVPLFYRLFGRFKQYFDEKMKLV